MNKRSWRTVALIVVGVMLVALLYPQLQDFGAELYRFFDGGRA